jgi:hypothetical protein
VAHAAHAGQTRRRHAESAGAGRAHGPVLATSDRQELPRVAAVLVGAAGVV